jgi:predicted nucleotidyltransferase component of viral defense system
MKTISTEQLSAVVEVDQLGLCELNPSILEKDLLITDVLGLLAAFEWGEVQPVFCGGTSLSKGYGLIQRMSEDIDFKLVLPEAWSPSQSRRELRELRHRLAERLREAGYALPEAGITAQNENRYACFALGYAPQFPLATALRAELRLDFTVHAPQMATTAVQVEPLLAQYMPWPSTAVDHQAVAVSETMVEKVVSFLRRTAGWHEQQDHDPEDAQLVRHLYDVHQLLLATPQDTSAMQLQQQLFNHTVAVDQQKFGRRDQPFGSNPRRQLEQALAQLQRSAEIEALYERFVGDLVWGPAVPYEMAREGFTQLASALLAGLDPPP